MKNETGITLIALIITIIILVILAAVSIRAAYNSGIIDYSINGTQKYISEAEEEEKVISGAEDIMKSAMARIENLNDEDDTEPKVYNEDDWIIAWAFDGEDWSNPYSREEGLIEEYFENIDNNYSISSMTELNNASVKAFLYPNLDNTGYSLVFSGNDAIVVSGPNYDSFQPWKGKYWVNSEIVTSDEYVEDFLPDIKRIEIKNGITEIGRNAFFRMPIEYLEIPGTVTYVGNYAFCDCRDLIDVEFASDFNGIFETSSGESDAFLYCMNWLYSLVEAGQATEAYSGGTAGGVTYTINGRAWTFCAWVD